MDKKIFVTILMVFFLVSCSAAHRQILVSPTTIEISEQIPDRPDVKKLAEEIEKYWYNMSRKNQMEILYLIIRNHPEQGIRKLEKMLADEEIFFVAGQMGNMASFSIHPAKEIYKQYKPRHKKPFYQILAVHPLNFFCPGEQEILLVMIALDHEMTHYMQWLLAGPVGKDFFNSIYDRVKGSKKNFTPESCHYLWSIEKAAYRRSCEMSKAWQMDPKMIAVVCQYDSEEEFILNIHQEFTKGGYSFFKECIPEWDKEIATGNRGAEKGGDR
jgi:hypothetical protein